MLKNKATSVRHGFTLLEVLVVIFAIAVLITLLIPAVQYGREASRRLSCAGNLKQLGLSLASYESTYKNYPRGGNRKSYSGLVSLLPYLDQSSLYNSINLSEYAERNGLVYSANFTAGRNHLAFFCCPSDPDASINPTTTYAFNGGYGLQLDDFVGTFCDATRPNARAISSSDILKGLSNTAAMTEWKLGRFNSFDVSTVVYRIRIPLDQGNFPAFVQKCTSASRETTEFGSWSKDAHWMVGSFGSSIMNFNSLPATQSCLYGDSIDFGNWPASSYHPSGVQVLYHDGHVALWSNGAILREWQNISNRSN